MPYYVIGVSVIGEQHKRYNESLADYWGCRYNDGICVNEETDNYVIGGLQVNSDRLLLVVADGAGSAEKGRVGARIAVMGALGTELHDDGISVVQSAFRNALKNLILVSKKSNDKIDAYATTLTIAYIVNGICYASGIGDGAVIVLEPNDRLKVLVEPIKGEYFNETVFITSREYIGIIENGVHVNTIECKGSALITDGLWPVLIKHENKYIPYKKFFMPLFQHLKIMEPKKLAWALTDLLSKRKDLEDDKTIVAALIK